MIDFLKAPKNQERVIGHSSAYEALKKAHVQNQLHHALLLTGVKGIGKATLAWQIAKALLCGKPKSLKVDLNHPDLALIAAGSHPDLFILEASENNSIAAQDVRYLKNFVSKTPMRSTCKVVLIDSLEALNRFGLNALLKSLEEPVGEVYFFLICHESRSLLPTIRSRCQTVFLSPLNDLELECFSSFSSLEPTKKALISGRPGILSAFIQEETFEMAWDEIIQSFKTILENGYISVEKLKELAGKMKTYSWARYGMVHFLRNAVRLSSNLPADVLPNKIKKLVQAKDLATWLKMWDNWQRLEQEVTALSLSWNEALLVFFMPLQGKIRK